MKLPNYRESDLYLQSPAICYIHPREQDESRTGFPSVYLHRVLRGRWGLDSAFATTCKYPITTSLVWPEKKTKRWERSYGGAVFVEDNQGNWERILYEEGEDEDGDELEMPWI